MTFVMRNPSMLLNCPPAAASRRAQPIRTSATDAAAAATPPPLAVITGANTGIGYETAKALLQRGYRVTMACRDQQRMEAARQRLLDAVPGAPAVDFLQLDLADLATVRTAAAVLLDSGEQLSVLINNAGVMATPPMKTKDGFEFQLGINHLSHFLLTALLRPLLEAPDTPTRVVNVSSVAHFTGHMHFDELMFERPGAYNPLKSYGQSKLANVLFTYELARRLRPDANCTVATLHPGVVNTELFRYFVPENPAWWQRGLMNAAQKFVLTPEQGARTSVFCATAPGLANAKYYSSCKPVTSSPESYDPEVATQLWERSSELVGL